jgi:hypothetical protein
VTENKWWDLISIDKVGVVIVKDSNRIACLEEIFVVD